MIDFTVGRGVILREFRSFECYMYVYKGTPRPNENT